MPFAPVKVQSITLRSQVASSVREAILDGSLAPGERIVERALAAQFGASLTVIREAIVQLETEGLITKKSNATTHVTLLSQAEVIDTFAVREQLERFAIAEAARRATPADLARLAQLQEEVVAAAKLRQHHNYVQKDFSWHEALWSISGNDVLTATLKRVALPLFGFSAIRIAAAQNFDLVEDARLHEKIQKAVGRNNQAAAIKAFDSAFSVWRFQVIEEAV
jgi:DNA-binding GntR family transcriptional regulator